MTLKPPDTRKICEALKATRLTHKQSAALSDLFKDHDDGYREEFVTKAELESFGNRLIIKVIGGGIVALGAVVALAGLFFNVGSQHGNATTAQQPISTPATASAIALPQLSPSAGIAPQNAVTLPTSPSPTSSASPVRPPR